MKVKAYYNLHKACWSVVACEGEHKGRVIIHADALTIRNAEFKVSEAGRQRVLNEQRKNVHAFVVGDLHGFIGTLRYDMARPAVYWTHHDLRWVKNKFSCSSAVSYNPYRAGHFYEVDSIDEALSARYVFLDDNRKVHARGLAIRLTHIEEVA